jgi:tetratricopeptide (TPR) repeat protein
LFVLALAAAVVLAYLPVWYATYIFDDNLHLLANPILRPGGLARTWIPGKTSLNYWPLTFSTYWLEFQAWKLDPLGFHLVNVGLHILVSLLVWRVLLRLKFSPVAAMLAAAIFALHPVGVETVAWVSQTKTLLPAMFALLSMLFYLDFDQRGSWWRYALAIGAFMLAALARGMAVTLPIVLLMAAWWQRGRITWRDVLRIVPYIVIGVGMSVVEVVMQQRVTGTVVVRGSGPGARLLAAGWAAWFYLGKLICPMKLTLIYPHWQVTTAKAWCYVPGVLLLALLIAAWGARRSWGRPALMVAICYLALLLPVLGFVNIYFMRYSLVADHYQYLAMAVPIAAAAALLVAAAKRLSGPARFWLVGLPVAGILVVLAGLTVVRAGVFREPKTLWADTLAKNPQCWSAYENIGVGLGQAGKYELAAAQFRKAIAVEPGFAEAYNNLGNALLGLGKTDEALVQFHIAVALLPEYASAHCNIGNALLSQGKGDQAVACYRKALECQPEFPEALNNLGTVLLERGDVDEAIADFRQAVELQPNYAEARQNLQNAIAKKRNSAAPGR